MRTVYHPEKHQIELAAVLGALSDPTRLRIIAFLSTLPEANCGAFGDHASKTNLSYHLQRLREAGVTRTRLDGTQRIISLRCDDLDERFPGLLDSILAGARQAAETEPAA
jgi:DNA-binding transcriptional ArsR family regulator